MHQELAKKIRDKEATIALVGLGRVGLLTATMFAKSGYQLIGVDIKPDVIEAVSSGRSHIKEPGLEELIREIVGKGKLKVTADVQKALSSSDIAIVCVQTPVDENKKPDRSRLRKACLDIAKSLTKGKLVIIESSVPPRTTIGFVAKILESKSKLKCGKDFWLAHCPERISVGNAVRDFIQTARIIGGYDKTSTELTAELFKNVTKGEIYATDCTTAETAKLAENSFRDVNIAFANELALICEEIDVDVVDVIRLANTHPRVKIHNPGSGVGGPCLPKDPLLLLSSVKKRGSKLTLMQLSRKLNDYMPEHTVALVAEALKKVNKDIKTSKLTVLGTAYRGEIDDTTNSPAEKIVKKLTKLGSKVVVYDPYTTESFGAQRAPDIVTALEGADCVVIITEHEMFRNLKLEELKNLMAHKPVIADGKRLFNPAKARELGFAYVGVGYHA